MTGQENFEEEQHGTTVKSEVDDNVLDWNTDLETNVEQRGTPSEIDIDDNVFDWNTYL